MKAGRGFLMTRNMKTGDLRPFFIRVREEDIIRNDGTSGTSDVAKVTMEQKWLCETHTDLKRIKMFRRLAIPQLTYVSERKCTGTITLPNRVNPGTAVISINKESNDVQLLEDTYVEASFGTPDQQGLTDIINVKFINPSKAFTKTNVSALSGILHISVNGFTE